MSHHKRIHLLGRLGRRVPRGNAERQQPLNSELHLPPSRRDKRAVKSGRPGSRASAGNARRKEYSAHRRRLQILERGDSEEKGQAQGLP